MAKTVAERPAKVTKPRTSLLSAVAESSKKSDAKAQPATAEKPSSKAAGKRKSTEENHGVEKVKKVKVATEEPKQSVTTAKKAEVKAEAKGKKRVGAIEEQPEEPKTVAPSKSKDTKSKKVAISKSKAKKSPSPPPEESEEQVGSESEADAAEGEEDVQLFGFSTDDDNDSSDDDMSVNPDPVDVGKLPTIAKDDATVKKKLEKAKRKPVRIYIFCARHHTH